MNNRHVLGLALFTAVLGLLFAPSTASASLIGDSATVEVFTGASSLGSQSATVDTSGTPEFSYFTGPDNALTVDIESSTIQIDFIDGFTGLFVLGDGTNPIKIQITDLDWVGQPGIIVGASIVGGPSAFGETVQVTGPHAVEVVVNANNAGSIGGTFLSILVQLQTDHAVGGEILPIDSTALLIAAAQSPAAWMTSVTFAIIGVGAFLITRNPNNIKNIKVILRDYLDRL